MRKLSAIVLIALAFQGCISVNPYADVENTDLCHNPIKLEVCAGESRAYFGESNVVLEPYECYGVLYYKLKDIGTKSEFLKVSGDVKVRIGRLDEKLAKREKE